MIYLSACPNSKSELSYRLNVLDNISILELALWSVFLNELGETVRDMEFMRVRIGLGTSETFNSSISVLVECLSRQLKSGKVGQGSQRKDQARPLRQRLRSSSELREEQLRPWRLSERSSPFPSVSSSIHCLVSSRHDQSYNLRTTWKPFHR